MSILQLLLYKKIYYGDIDTMVFFLQIFQTKENKRCSKKGKARQLAVSEAVGAGWQVGVVVQIIAAIFLPPDIGQPYRNNFSSTHA